MANIELLDCTLRDGAYIVDAKFGSSAMKGIISKLQQAQVDLIECGWLKNAEHTEGTSFFHVPGDAKQYILDNSKDATYVAMIDWDRYDLNYLPVCDGESLDAIRVVFPHNKYKEGINVGKQIKEKGYKVYFQAANTLAYTDEELSDLAREINSASPVCLSIVDTFGAMYEEDLDRILTVLNRDLDKEIKIGFHSHNNQQLAFANSMHFVKELDRLGRDGIVDASLCGMGRGAGNATTELVVNYLNRKCQKNYGLDEIMDAIDIYMEGFKAKYTWGYSTSYYIAGIYCCHVNNIAYLQNNHRTNSHDMRQIIESLGEDDRKKYDYDLLEAKYIENQSRLIDDTESIRQINNQIEKNGKVLLIAPGKSAIKEQKRIKEFIEKEEPVVFAVNALLEGYEYNYLFLTNKARYEYAKTTYSEKFLRTHKILLSNVADKPLNNELVINFDKAVKKGWPHFDNAMICCLRMLKHLNVKEIYLAGFDGFKNEYNESYADESLPTINPGKKWEELNEEIKDMFDDVKKTTQVDISFITESIYEG